MDIEELAAELAALKEESARSKEEKRLGGFIDRYGMKFNNNTGIANLALAEMDRLGVDEASEAASEALQAVLDKLREECTSVLSDVQQKEQVINDLTAKIDNVQQAVDNASTGQTEAPPPGEGAPSPDMGAGATPPAGDMGGGAPPPMEGMPPAGDMGGGAPPMEGTPPAGDIGAGAPPMEGAPPVGDMGGGAPPMEGTPPAEMPPMEGPPPNMVPSDARIKQLRGKFAAYAQKRKAATVPSDQNIKKVWKPRSETLSAIRGLI